PPVPPAPPTPPTPAPELTALDVAITVPPMDAVTDTPPAAPPSIDAPTLDVAAAPTDDAPVDHVTDPESNVAEMNLAPAAQPTIDPAVPVEPASQPVDTESAETVPVEAAPVEPAAPAATPAAPATAPTGPALPPQTAAKPAPPPTAAAASFTASPYGWDPSASSAKVRKRSLGSTIARTIFGAIALAGAGIGARFAWEEIETRADDVRGADTPIGELPVATRTTSAAAVEMRVSITGPSGAGGSGVSVSALTAPATGDVTLDAVVLDERNVPAGETVQLDRLGGSFVTYDPLSQSWVPGDPFGFASAATAIDELAVHHTLADVLPADARPYATLLESTAETLDALPIDPSPSTSTVPGPSAPPVPTVPEVVTNTVVGSTPGAIESAEEVVEQVSTAPTPVGSPTRSVATTRYRIQLDVSAFAASEPIAYAAWSDDRLSFDDTVDVWIDDSGHLRRVRSVGSDGVSGYDITWVSMSSDPIDVLRSDDQAGS
ncbi:MAG: hypothetical protein AAGD33_17265, partial [Actinomycetota bacterium]